MSRILVCPEMHAGSVIAEHAPSHVVGLSSPTGDRIATRSQDDERGSTQQQLHLRFHDIAAPRAGLVAPSRADIAALLAFGRGWNEAAPLLVHCEMGISRSTAAALILAAALRPARAETEIAAALRVGAPCATPNPLMIALADELLGRSGRLVAAAADIGRGADYVPYRMFALVLDPAP